MFLFLAKWNAEQLIGGEEVQENGKRKRKIQTGRYMTLNGIALHIFTGNIKLPMTMFN